MIDASSLPDGTPLWFTLTFVAISSLLLFSERVAKIKGPMGSLARWWEDRQQSEIDRIQDANDRIEDAAKRRYGFRINQLEDSMARLESELKEERADRKRERKEMSDRYEGQIIRAQRERDLFAAWAEHILSWWRVQAQWLAQQGISLPHPHLPIFSEFRQQWLDRNNSNSRNNNTSGACKEG